MQYLSFLTTLLFKNNLIIDKFILFVLYIFYTYNNVLYFYVSNLLKWVK